MEENEQYSHIHAKNKTMQKELNGVLFCEGEVKMKKTKKKNG